MVSIDFFFLLIVDSRVSNQSFFQATATLRVRFLSNPIKYIASPLFHNSLIVEHFLIFFLFAHFFSAINCPKMARFRRVFRKVSQMKIRLSKLACVAPNIEFVFAASFLHMVWVQIWAWMRFVSCWDLAVP